MKKLLVSLLVMLLAVTTVFAQGAQEAADDGGLIRVGIINNDPNESGYRTANDNDMKAMFTEENGYDASFFYSLRNDEQIAAAQNFIQNEVDYLLISAAGTAGWDSVLQDAQNAGIQSYPIWPLRVRRLSTGSLPRILMSTTSSTSRVSWGLPLRSEGQVLLMKW